MSIQYTVLGFEPTTDIESHHITTEPPLPLDIVKNRKNCFNLAKTFLD